MADTDTSTATPPAAPPPTMGDSAAGITALNKQYQPQLGAAEQATLDYMKQGSADRAPLTADVNRQEAALSGQLAKAPAPDKEPDAPDLKFKKVSFGALLGTIAAGLVAGRAAKTGPMLTAAASLNALVAANNTGEQNRIAAAEKDYDAQLKKVDRHNADMRQQFDDITNLMKTNVTMAKDRLDTFNAAYTDGLSIHTQQAKSLQQAYTVALHGVQAQLDAQSQLENVKDSHARLGLERERLEKEGWDTYTDKGNGDAPFRMNKDTGAAVDMRGKPYTPIKPMKMGTANSGAASAVSQRFNDRIVSAAALATADAGNLMQLPLSSSSGLLGQGHTGSIFDASKNALAQSMTPQDDQTYKVMATGLQRNLSQIESAGLAPSGSLTNMMESAIANPGDTGMTKLHRFAQIRQIVDVGLDALKSDPTLSDLQRQKADELVESIHKSIPFTHADLIKFDAEGRGDETFGQYSQRVLGNDLKAAPKPPAPALDEWLKQVRPLNPGVSDADLTAHYKATHGDQ